MPRDLDYDSAEFESASLFERFPNWALGLEFVWREYALRLQRPEDFQILLDALAAARSNERPAATYPAESRGFSSLTNRRTGTKPCGLPGLRISCRAPFLARHSGSDSQWNGSQSDSDRLCDRNGFVELLARHRLGHTGKPSIALDSLRIRSGEGTDTVRAQFSLLASSDAVLECRRVSLSWNPNANRRTHNALARGTRSR
jgi:hypothetical protein